MTKLGLKRKLIFILSAFRVNLIQQKLELAHKKGARDYLKMIAESSIIELNEDIRKWVSWILLTHRIDLSHLDGTVALRLLRVRQGKRPLKRLR